MIIKHFVLKKIASAIVVVVLLLFSFKGFAQDIGVYDYYNNDNAVSDSSANSPNTNNSTDFGTASSITFLIINSRGAAGSIPDLTVNSIILGNTTDFEITTAPYTLPYSIRKGNSQWGYTLPFKISLKGTSCGTFTSTVTISSNAINDGSDNTWTFTIRAVSSPEINVLGAGISIVDGDTTPSVTDNTDFGNAYIGTSIIKTFTIQNTGNCTLTNGAFSFSGTNAAEFTLVTAPTLSLASGATTTFQVRFTPTAAGTRTAAISFANNDANENPYNFSIQGTGVATITVGPGGVTADLKLWLRADLLDGTTSVTDNANVTTWKTQSGGSDAIKPTEIRAPKYRNIITHNINFNAVVDFTNNYATSPQVFTDNNSDREYLKGATGFYSQDLFVVLIPDVTVTASLPSMDIFTGDRQSSVVETDVTGIGYGAYTNRFDNEVLTYALGTSNIYGAAHMSTTASYNSVGIVNARNNAATTGMQLFFNGNNVVTSEVNVSTFANVSNSRYWIGRSEGWDGSLDGRIAEIITYSSRKEDAIERRKIESYLAIKYGITLGVNGTSQNYVNSNNVPIWNVADNIGYNNDIAGIGRDDASKLNQKQSKSVNANSIVTIGLGAIAATNTANTNIFAVDKSYLVWGHNNASLADAGSNFGKTIGTSIIANSRMFNRKWKIVETTGDVAEVIVSIPTASLNLFTKTENDEYVLIVSSTAAFLDADIVDIIPLKMVGSNLQTWYDFDGIRFFTFGITPKTESKYQSNIGAGDYFVGENNINLNSTFTISSWIRNSNSGSLRTFISKGTDYELKINTANLVEVSWTGITRITAKTSIGDGKWHHMAITYAGGSASLYMDGILDKIESSLPIPTSSTEKFSIGATYNNKSPISNPFLGDIDEVRIWDTALTEVQLRYLMNQEMEKYEDNSVNGKTIPQMITLNDVKTIPWTNVKAYYDLNTYYGTTSDDKSNNRNFLRVKYLNATKSVVNMQTAPLPYKSLLNGAWDTAGTWLNGDVQNLPNTTITQNGISNEITWNIVETSNSISSIGNKTLLGLIVNNDGSITASNDSKIEVSHYLKLNGIIDLQGKSQLVQTLGSDLEQTSAGKIIRSQQGVGNKYSYNYWSSPVGPINATTNNNNYTATGVFKDGTSAPKNITWIGGYDGNNANNQLSLARYWLWKFENGTAYSNWVKINENDLIRPSQGFTVKGASSVGSGVQNYTFVGKPYNGNIAANSILAENYFLVGNPYPSSLNGQQFIADNKDVITGTIYFWEQSSGNNTHYLAGYTGGYSTLSGTGGVGPIAPAGINGLGQGSYKVPKQFIPVGQGFYVIGKTGISGQQPIVFNNGQRSFQKENSDESTYLFKNEAVAKGKAQFDHFTDNSNDPIIDEKLVKIRLGFNTTDKFHRQLLLGFMNEKATDGEDYGYDAEQIDTRDNDMFFPINNAKFIIQGVGHFDVNKIYPLGIGVTIGGNVQFVLDEVLNLPLDVSICVFDKLTGETQNISRKAFEINLEPGTYLDRFSLTFKTQKLVAEDVTAEILIPATAQPIIEGIHVFMNNASGELQIKNNSTEEILSVALINTVGQTIKTWNSNFNIRTISLPISTATGVYLVQINTKTGKSVKKISVE